MRLRFAYLAYVHLCAQSKAGTMYKARKAKIARTKINDRGVLDCCVSGETNRRRKLPRLRLITRPGVPR